MLTLIFLILRFVKILYLILLPFSTATSASAQIIASWNIQNLGWNNGKDYQALGIVGSHFDLIAVQEVMSEEGIIRFQEALEDETLTAWDRSCSHLKGRGSYKEMYCFVWRMDSFELEGGETVFLDSQDVFAREPYSAIFRAASGFRFKATSIHAIYGNSVEERQREALALREYYDWLAASFPDLPIFLMGDFNLAPTNPAWQDLGEILHPLIQDGSTTISSIDGRFANLYDNIWVPAGRDLPITSYGRLEFPHQTLGITHEEARASVSDHIPVWVRIDMEAPARRFDPHMIGGQRAGNIQHLRGTPERAAAESSEPGSVIANRNSGVFHLPGCPSYDRVAQHNQIHFGTETEARAAGFRRAGNC